MESSVTVPWLNNCERPFFPSIPRAGRLGRGVGAGELIATTVFWIVLGSLFCGSFQLVKVW